VSLTHCEALLLGDSPQMQQLRHHIARVAASRIPVLIEGPTGSGKELVAQAVHANSGRVGSLVAVNVCAIADTMFEDSMFGHMRGSFSGAISDHAGHLMEAHRGTVFLDEIGGLQLGAQVKLLRALETREFRPVGARNDRTSDFRLISATNVPLSQTVSSGHFRADLAFRLSGVLIRVPALASHPEDIRVLARHFAQRASAQRGMAIELSERAISKLEAHAWPGNVRELRHIVECAVEFATTSRVELEDLLQLLDGSSDSAYHDLPAFERRRLLDTLRACDWDMARTAESLGVHLASIYRRVRRLGIDLRNERAGALRGVNAPADGGPGSAKGAENPQTLGRG
jgi:DNA-binding NtrC family response regulator